MIESIDDIIYIYNILTTVGSNWQQTINSFCMLLMIFPSGLIDFCLAW